MDLIDDSVVRSVLRALRDIGYMRTAHMLERESCLFFDTNYFTTVVMSGDWNEAEDYLSGFAKPLRNQTSKIIYFDIRYIKFLEALERKNFNQATKILDRGLQIFRRENEARHEELVRLLLEAQRIHESQPPIEEDHVMARRKALAEKLKWLIEINSLTRKKLVLSEVESLNDENDEAAADNLHLFRAMSSQKNEMRPLADASSSSNVPSGACPGRMGHGYQYQAVQGRKSVDAPHNVAAALIIGTRPTSMDFHPHIPTLLLVGTCVGNVGLWDVTYGELLSLKTFGLSNLGDCSSELQIIFGKIASEDANDDKKIPGDLEHRDIAVNRVVWCPDGILFGVAYSKNIVQLFTHSNGRQIQKAFECNAHEGSVNDLAFATLSGQLSLITCGEDNKIQVWNVASGENTASLVFHESSVYCVCLDTKEGVPVLYSISSDGKLVKSYCTATSQEWSSTYISLGQTKLICCPKTRRIYSCGTGYNGVSALLGWEFLDENTSMTSCIFQPFPHCVMKFGMSDTRLAACANHEIRFWTINNRLMRLGILTFDRDMPITSEICFNKDGTLLAVEANGTSIKILACNKGLALLSNLRASAETRDLDSQRKSRRKDASSSSRQGSNDLKEELHDDHDWSPKGRAEENGKSEPDSKILKLS